MTSPVERYFVWLDAEGIRCGPRHGGLKAALNYAKATREALGGWQESREKYPSSKPPARLIACELVERDMTPDEKRAYEMWAELDRMGLA